MFFFVVVVVSVLFLFGFGCFVFVFVQSPQQHRNGWCVLSLRGVTL